MFADTKLLYNPVPAAMIAIIKNSQAQIKRMSCSLEAVETPIIAVEKVIEKARIPETRVRKLLLKSLISE